MMTFFLGGGGGAIFGTTDNAQNNDVIKRNSKLFFGRKTIHMKSFKLIVIVVPEILRGGDTLSPPVQNNPLKARAN